MHAIVWEKNEWLTNPKRNAVEVKNDITLFLKKINDFADLFTDMHKLDSQHKIMIVEVMNLCSDNVIMY